MKIVAKFHIQWLPVSIIITHFNLVSSLRLDVDMDKWNQKKEDLLAKCGQEHFSRDINLTKKENKAGKILAKLRSKMMDQDDTVMIGAYYQKLPTLLSCDLYKLLDVMPKPVVHHLHLTAAAPISFLVEKLCYFNHVYFSQKD